ncbi:PDR/VanB family oxidoreductase [Streptomyces apocyni]|uniref:PDR/VanB family oxidoreductase n=1 Tax=Streptomyces apocyni TaxID=2654677 RepID=UPI0012EA65DA|nr:PDR/VanB family oxidoreductase [Streptomyces apocyni]
MPRTHRTRTRTLIAAAGVGAALLARRAMRRRIARSPLWPMPALERPVSGRPRARTRRMRIIGRETIADGVVQLRLEGRELPAWEPGAHLDLVLPSGLVRQYSLCGDPADPTSYTVATRLIPEDAGGRGGSREVHEELREGTEIEVRGPRNRFPLESSHAYVFIAGGIGITPILPMVRAAQASGAEWRLLYGGRDRASMPFLEELEEIEKLGAGTGRVTVVPQDEAGLPDLGALFSTAEQAAAVYCCGPEGLMNAVSAALPPGCTLHLERFAPPATAMAGHSGGPFEVELRRSGRTVTVGPDESVLTAVRRELPDTPYSCQQGFCGTCQQRVLGGEIDHRDELLTDSERAHSMLICVSRGGDEGLVLDL